MDIAFIKSEIYKKLETLDEQGLLEVNEMVSTYLKNLKIKEHWDELTVVQQQGILKAVESIKSGKGIKHEVVMEKYRQQYAVK